MSHYNEMTYGIDNMTIESLNEGTIWQEQIIQGRSHGQSSCPCPQVTSSWDKRSPCQATLHEHCCLVFNVSIVVTGTYLLREAWMCARVHMRAHTHLSFGDIVAKQEFRTYLSDYSICNVSTYYQCVNSNCQKTELKRKTEKKNSLQWL